MQENVAIRKEFTWRSISVLMQHSTSDRHGTANLEPNDRIMAGQNHAERNCGSDPFSHPSMILSLHDSVSLLLNSFPCLPGGVERCGARLCREAVFSIVRAYRDQTCV